MAVVGGGELFLEFLGEESWGFEIDGEVAVEILFGQVVKVRGVEDRGGIDEEVDRAEMFVSLLKEFSGSGNGIGKIGLDESDFDAEGFEFGSRLLGFVA